MVESVEPVEPVAKAKAVDSVVQILQPEQAPPPALAPDRKVSYEYTPPDTMNETLNVSVEGTPPKKRSQKLKEETPVKESFAGSKSKEVHCRDSIEFVRPASSRRNKTRSSVFDFTPPKTTPRRIPNGIGKSPYATHEPKTNGIRDEYRPTTPFAEHNHVTEQQVFSPRRERTITPVVKTPVPPPFRRPPPGGYCNNIFG
ncbi:hypothetical protein ACHWQZ_G017191 [Mnemiopsis leidyi]